MKMRITVESSFHNGNTWAGMAGGTILVILLRMDMQEIGHTVLLAAIGAVVSFTVSVLLRYIIRKFLRK